MVACGTWSQRQRFGLHYYVYTPSSLSGGDLPLALWMHGGVRTTEENVSASELARTPFFAGQNMQPAALLRPVARYLSHWMAPWIGPGTGSHNIMTRPPPSLGIASAVLDRVVHRLRDRVDPRRIVVSGASMGGYATWELVLRRPDVFEAAVPISGGGDPKRARLLNRTRVWLFHSADDPIVSS
jgi:predicted peptidase